MFRQNKNKQLCHFLLYLFECTQNKFPYYLWGKIMVHHIFFGLSSSYIIVQLKMIELWINDYSNMIPMYVSTKSTYIAYSKLHVRNYKIFIFINILNSTNVFFIFTWNA